MQFDVSTSERVDVVDVTDRVRDAVPDECERGVCTVFVRHTTAGVVVNEAERRLLGDVELALETLVPREDGYDHDVRKTTESSSAAHQNASRSEDDIDDNADAHLRAMLLGESASIPVRDGDLALGTWQSVLFVECDGPRTRTVDTTVTTE